MSLTPQRTIYPCKEFEPIEVPLDQIIVSGKIQLYPESEKYFDLDYRAGQLVVAPKSYIGLIPLNDRIAIHVRPRFPIENVFYLIKKASATLRFIDGHVRSYSSTGAENFDPLAELAHKFVGASESLFKSGLLRRYEASAFPAPFSGTLDMTETITAFRSQGILYKHHWSSDELTDDIEENRLIKHALVRVIGLLIERSDLSSQKALRTLRHVYREFDNVGNFVPDPNLTEIRVAGLIKRLPYQHRNYAQLIWLAFLIVTRRGLLIESLGTLNFDTFVVNLADIFEDFVRNIISEHFHLKNDGFSVKNGNKDQISLFRNDNTYKVKPDIYIHRNNVGLAVIDAKYKPSIKAADRYEVISFCEALQVKRAIVVSPRVDENRTDFLGTTPGGIEFWHSRISLSPHDMRDEERDFLASISDLIARPLGS
jgi:5-methylcytosine-specific restriction enzyme subunit McrC